MLCSSRSSKQGYGLDKLVNDENAYVRENVAKHGYGLDKLVYDEDGAVRREVRYYLSDHGYKSIFDWAEANSNKVVTDLDIDEWLVSDNAEKRLQVAEYGYDLDKLVNDENDEVREAVAKHGYGFNKLVYDKNEGVRKAIAKQGYGLDVLINDEDWMVREAVAKQGYGLDILINDSHSFVRYAVAEQGYGLDILINDSNTSVREAVAKQGYGLDKLVNDEEWPVRLAVAEQGYRLDKLIYDKDGTVRGKVNKYLKDNGYKSVFDWAEANPNKVVTDLDIDEWLVSDNAEKRLQVAKHGYGLDILINDKDGEVRQAVAEQGYGLDKLVNDRYSFVRQEVAKHGYGLDKLMYDKYENVLQAVAEQGYGLDKLINDGYYDICAKVQYYLSEHGYKTIFDWANDNPDKVITDIDINEWLISDNKYKRLQVAEYGYGLDKLTNDEDSDIREKVKCSLKHNKYKSIVDWVEANPEKVYYKDYYNKLINFNNIIKSFIDKIDSTSKLKVETSCNSIDEFFDYNDEIYINNESINIIAVDTKESIIKLIKLFTNEEESLKIIDEDDNSNIFKISDSSSKFADIIMSIIEQNSKLNKYADDLESCL